MEIMDIIGSKYNYWMYILLMMIGFYAMIAKRNLVKKVIGLNIFQTAIILFFVSTASKQGATIPILHHGASGAPDGIQTALYMNPLPHVLMLTAIVVMVSTFGVAVALLILLYRKYGTLEEDEILEILRSGTGP